MPGTGPFRPGTGPVRLIKVFPLIFFSFFITWALLEKIGGQLRLVFDFGWGYLRAPGSLPPSPPDENPAPASDWIKDVLSNASFPVNFESRDSLKSRDFSV